MANILIVGGGFAGVVAAESLVKHLGPEHHLTLVSRRGEFLFYPALVRLAFGKCKPSDISFDLREAMLDRRVRLIEGEIARVNPYERQVTIAHGELAGEMPYDFLILALGQRLATERVTGLFEHAHHLLTTDASLKFGEAARSFHQGKAVIGYCPGARLPVPVFETAIALSSLLEERGKRDRCTITIVSNETPDEMFGGVPVSDALRNTLKLHGIEFIPDFAISRVKSDSIIASDGRTLKCDLSMLIPPFLGPAAVLGTGITNPDGYVGVDTAMRVLGAERMYAAGDCVSFQGPKLGHMAVRQAQVAADNVAAEIQGREPVSYYDHELMLVIGAGPESIYIHQDLWTDDPAQIKQGRFWAWAKRLQEQYWTTRHA
jgi:sulfide:quinone oxidoreductase